MVNWMISGILVALCWSTQWNVRFIHPNDVPPSNFSFACDLVVDAGPDTNVCAPGGSLMLQGNITGNAIYYQWTPFTGLSNPFILNPTANINGPITYTLTAYGVDPNNPNLVVNGDFSAGNTGFVSEYSYVADIAGIQNEMVPEGTYTVINNPNLVHWGFSACNDHTGGGGNMMVVNGAANLQDIWCHTVSVAPNGWYNVSAWVASVNPSSPAQIQFSINGTPIGPIINALSTPCSWIPFNATWNSGTSTSAEICILNLNTALGGNDFALDDISMVGLCTVEDEVTITLYEEEAPEPDIDGPAFLCAGETAIYTASFPSDPPIYFYHWDIPPGATLLDGQGTPVVTVLWEDAQEGEICLEIETRCDMNEACFDVIVGTLPEFPVIYGPASLCPGETTTFYTDEQGPDDQYTWHIPSQLFILSGQGTPEIDLEWAQEGESEICLEVTNACGTSENCVLIQLWESYTTFLDTTICEGTTIEINGTIYGNGLDSGFENFTSIHGCDSLVEVSVSEADALEFMVSHYLCPGDSVFLEGIYQTEEGIYTDSFTTITGCDSLVISEVIISPFDTTWITLASCNPADTGTTIQTISQGNCDSTVITSVALYPTDTTIITLYSCAPSDTGQVIHLLSNQYGCDSLILTNTLLLRSDTTTLFQSTCDPSGAGVSQQLHANIFGCDSLVITTVWYLESDTTLIMDHTCFLSDTGTFSTLHINSKGCDSLVIVQTSYAGSDTTFITQQSCFSTDSGIVISNLVNHYGCDSILYVYTTLLPSDTTYLLETSCEPLDTGTIIKMLTNRFGCDSLIIATTTLSPAEQCSIEATLAVQQPLCSGDKGVVDVATIVGLAPFTIHWQHSSQPESGSSVITTTPGTHSISLSRPGMYYFTISSANGLSVNDTIGIDMISPLTVTSIPIADLFGYHISCYGDSTGTVITELTGTGTPPHQYAWSNGSNASQLNQLFAGHYMVTVTDIHGCTSTSSVTLTEPPPLHYVITTEDIKCFGQENGILAIAGNQGGIPPWQTSLDHGPFVNNLVYTGLSAGVHELVITDQNGCSFVEHMIIQEPSDWSILLGADTVIAFGNPYLLHASIYGEPFGNLRLEWSDGQCDDCLTRSISLTTGSSYTVTGTDDNGCSHTDDILIGVFIDRDLYVPNIFSPNGDGINDLFKITSGAGLQEIKELTIYDRWGNIVFQEFQFQPEDPAFQWNGTMNEKQLNPAVYVYKLIVVYEDLREEVRYGDVTLMR